MEDPKLSKSLKVFFNMALVLLGLGGNFVLGDLRQTRFSKAQDPSWPWEIVFY